MKGVGLWVRQSFKMSDYEVVKGKSRSVEKDQNTRKVPILFSTAN